MATDAPARPDNPSGNNRSRDDLDGDWGTLILTVLPGDRLRIEPGEDFDEVVRHETSMGRSPLDIWHELFRPVTENSALDHLQPHEIGALTANHTLVSDQVGRDDDGEITEVGRIFYFEPYQVRDPVDELRRGRPITLRVNPA
jgi:hypothetical protein